ncbi:hypothetical protein L1785_13685 [Antribacter sp. KLBMP9083]|uniref:Uncharacterized protein n=1 Tax=Antribacter soli TaxID=2910976 RepID=A0AA41QFV4_9MICO|nr:hypothetical protein [Antribacter soli]MCF4122030.1 hypothetical protein [Antribacter soli]
MTVGRTWVRTWSACSGPGGTTPLTGTVVQLPGGGHLAVTQHHDRVEEI